MFGICMWFCSLCRFLGWVSVDGVVVLLQGQVNFFICSVVELGEEGWLIGFGSVVWVFGLLCGG